MERTFRFRSVESGGKLIEGIVNAETAELAVESLRRRNLIPIEVNMEESKSADLFAMRRSKAKVKIADMAMFCRQLSTMLSAGLPISRALDTLHEQTTNVRMKSAIATLSNRVKQGVSLSRSMAEDPGVFPKILVSMVESGELNGKQDQALGNMAQHFIKENRIQKRVKGAMIYPIVLFTVAIVVAVIMLVFVAPMFAGMFESAGEELPGPTKLLMSISNSLQHYWFVYLGVIFGLAFTLRRYIKTPKGRYKFDELKLKIPIVKTPMQQIVTARFTRTLSTLLDSGVSMVDAVTSSADTTNNSMVSDKMGLVIQGLKSGHPLTGELTKTGIFPPIMLSMVGIGEETGEVDGLMLKTADFYEEELDSAIGKLLSLMEPLLILFMAVIIGFLLVALMVPMLTMVATSG